MVNKALLRDVMDHIEKLHEINPHVGWSAKGCWGSGDHWVQSAWHSEVLDATSGEACGTAACFAGWTLLRLGYKVREDECWSPDGKMGFVPHSAAVELGLSQEAAWKLFSGGNTIEDLRKIVDEYCK